MNKKSNYRRIPFVIIFILFGAVYSLFAGNPLFAHFAGWTAEKYIEENCPECHVEEIFYDAVGIFSGYRARIRSESDLSFDRTIYIDPTGLRINRKAMDFYYPE